MTHYLIFLVEYKLKYIVNTVNYENYEIGLMIPQRISQILLDTDEYWSDDVYFCCFPAFRKINSSSF